MSEALTGTFRLLRQANGVGAYATAAVEVRIDPSGAQPASANLDLDAGGPQLLDEEREAALSGARDALELLATRDARLAHAQVIVKRVGINHADTEPSAIRAATAAAVADAVGMGQNFSLHFDNGWKFCIPGHPGG